LPGSRGAKALNMRSSLSDGGSRNGFLRIKGAGLLIALISSLVLSQAAPAQLYQYFDEEGTRIVTDDPYGTKKKTPHQYREHPKQRQDVPQQGIRLNFRDDVSYNFYPVTGRSLPELVAATDSLGPFDAKEGRRYAAQTQWRYGLAYQLDFSYQRQGNLVTAQVNVHDIDFRPEITILLPELSDTRLLSAHELKLWEHYVQRILVHEHDHVRIVQDQRFRQEIVDGIAGIRELTFSAADEGRQDEAVRRAADSRITNVVHEHVRTIKQLNEAYDDVTDHGRKPEMRATFFQGL